MASNNNMTLNSSSNEINIVIRKDVELDTDSLEGYLDFNCSNYAYICHYHDINEKGEVEGIHYHIVAIYYSRKRKSTILRELCDLFKFDNADGIEVAKISSQSGSIQYLTHKRYPFKQQHEVSEIKYKWDEDEFNDLYTKEISYTFSYILKVLQNCSCVTDIIDFLGISYYQRYRATLLDMFNEVRKNENGRDN